MIVSAIESTTSTPILLFLLVTTSILTTKLLIDYNVFHQIQLIFEYLFCSVPNINVKMTDMELYDDGNKNEPMPVKKGKQSSTLLSIKDRKKPGKIQCYDPSTNQYLGEVIAMTSNDVNELCIKAKEAQKSWCKTTYKQRRIVLRTIQKYILQHIEDICRVCTRDSGKPKVDALLGEVMTTCEKIRCINSNGELWLRRSYRSTGPIMMHKYAYVEYVPLGVLGVIAPWNYPFHNMLNHVISGIFAGNAVVGKVSEHTSWSSTYFTNIIRQALIDNGHNPDLVQTITGFGDAGAALVSNHNVDKIIFTGSPNVGRKVMEGAAPHLKPVILELGGKDPMVFTDDVNLNDVIPWAMRGCYQNCGQNCCGVERLFVYESIYDEFIDRIKIKIQNLRQGIPLSNTKICGENANGDVDCGSMVMLEQINIIQELIDDAVKKGATLHVGGKRNMNLDGQFYEPTLISGITSEMRISQEEVFGPVMAISKVPDNDDEKCIQLINNCNFGLGSSVYCKDQKRGIEIGKRIRSGMFTVNDFGVNYLIQSLPFGGVNESGFDRFAGPEGLRGCCLERSMVIDAIPGVHTSIPKPIDYPINKDKGLPFAMSLIQLFYNESLWGKIQGIIGLIKYG